MDFKKEIDSRGLKIKWIAEKIEVNYNSLRVYLMDYKLMPTKVELKLKELLK